MFIGHFAVAFAAKKVSPKTSLGTLILAAEWIGLIFPVLVLAGVEHAGIKEGANTGCSTSSRTPPTCHSGLAGR